MLAVQNLVRVINKSCNARGLRETDGYYPCCFNEMTMDDGSSMIIVGEGLFIPMRRIHMYEAGASLSTLKFRLVGGPRCVRCAEQQHTR